MSIATFGNGNVISSGKNIASSNETQSSMADQNTRLFMHPTMVGLTNTLHISLCLTFEHRGQAAYGSVICSSIPHIAGNGVFLYMMNLLLQPINME